MKTKSFFLVFFLLTFISHSYAQDCVSITPFTIAGGESKDITIDLTNVATYTAFQLDLFLPEGITVATDGGDYLIDLSYTRRQKTHSIGYANHDSCMMITTFSTNNALFKGTSGPLITLTVTADASIDGGTYEIQMKNILFAKVESDLQTKTSVYFANTTTAVTVPSLPSFSMEGLTYTFNAGLGSVHVPQQSSSLSGAIVIPASAYDGSAFYPITSIGSTAFTNCSGLTEIHCKSATLIAAKSSSFTSVNKTTCTLFVPKGSLSSYQAAAGWNEFTKIYEEEDVSGLFSPGSVFALSRLSDNATLKLSGDYLNVSFDGTQTTFKLIYDGQSYFFMEMSTGKLVNMEDGSLYDASTASEDQLNLSRIASLNQTSAHQKINFLNKKGGYFVSLGSDWSLSLVKLGVAAGKSLTAPENTDIPLLLEDNAELKNAIGKRYSEVELTKEFAKRKWYSIYFPSDVTSVVLAEAIVFGGNTYGLGTALEAGADYWLSRYNPETNLFVPVANSMGISAGAYIISVPDVLDGISLTFKMGVTTFAEKNASSNFQMLGTGLPERKSVAKGYKLNGDGTRFELLTNPSIDPFEGYIAFDGTGAARSIGVAEGITALEDLTNAVRVYSLNRRIFVDGIDEFTITSLEGISYPQDAQLEPGAYVVRAAGKVSRVLVR